MTRHQDSNFFLASTLVVSASCVALFMNQRSHLQKSSPGQEHRAARSIQRTWRFSRMMSTVKCCDQGKVSKPQEQVDPVIIINNGLVDKDETKAPALKEDGPVVPSAPTNEDTFVVDSPAPRDIYEDDVSLPDMLPKSSPGQEHRAARSIQLTWRSARMMSTVKCCDQGKVSKPEEQVDPVIIINNGMVDKDETKAPELKEDGPVIPSAPTNEDTFVVDSPAPRDIYEDDVSLPDMLPYNMSPMKIAFPVKERNINTTKPSFFLVAVCAAIVVHTIMSMQSSDLTFILSQAPLPTNVETVVSTRWLEPEQCLLFEEGRRSSEPIRGMYGPYISYNKNAVA